MTTSISSTKPNNVSFNNNKNINSVSTALSANLTSDNLNDEYIKAVKSNGLVEKFYNFLKNKTGIGLGSDKLKQKINDAENGKINNDIAKKEINKYRISQENSAQNFGDMLAGAVSVTSFLLLNKVLSFGKGVVEVNKKILEKDYYSGRLKKFCNIVKSPKGIMLLAGPIMLIVGGITKMFALKFNRIGSSEYKADKNSKLSNAENKRNQKKLNKKCFKSNLKNFLTGSIDALLTPVVLLGGGLVGVPLYVLSTLGVRNLTNKYNDKDKSKISNVVDNIKDNALLNAVFTAAVMIPALKKARFTKTYLKNVSEAVKKINAQPLKNKFKNQCTVNEELEDLLLSSPKISAILKDCNMSNGEKINALTKENICAVKFLQTDGHQYKALSDALKEDCPPTFTVKEVQAEIDKTFGEKYHVSKLVGVGTMAESYLAKDKSGEDFCIKILKKGIDEAKIQKDKLDFINMVTKGSKNLTDEQKFLVKNIENWVESLLKEIDFNHEAEAAKKLAKYTKSADVVVPIDVKSHIYVMKKAPGVSVKTLAQYIEEETALAYYKKKGLPYKNIEENIRKIKEKAPDFNDIELSNQEIKKILLNYKDVLVEQFYKLDNNGKTIHGDIHPGNIFINLDVLKGKQKGNLFTLIDTGNTIDLTSKQNLASLRLADYIRKGDSVELTKAILDGAVLPKDLTEEQAQKLVNDDLKDIFFNPSTKLGKLNTSSFAILTNNILKKYKIISNDVQFNLNKAKKAAYTSFNELGETFFSKKYSNTEKNEKNMTNALVELADIGAKYAGAIKMQELKNLVHMSNTDKMKSLFNKTAPKENSEEKLIYSLKQYKLLDDDLLK